MTAAGLNREDLRSFKDKGHIHLSGILDPKEVSTYRLALREATYRINTERRKLAERDTYASAFLQTMNLWRQDSVVKNFVFKKQFAQIAAKLLGVEKVRLYHDQSLFKEAGGGYTPWHQDQYYWPLSTLNTITMWMPLTDLTSDMGLLKFATGSHKKPVEHPREISDNSQKYFDEVISKNGYPIHTIESMKAGNASFHYGSIIHGADPNLSENTREAMTIIYFEDGARVTTPINDAQETDRRTWLDGLVPGELAASFLNPILN